MRRKTEMKLEKSSTLFFIPKGAKVNSQQCKVKKVGKTTSHNRAGRGIIINTTKTIGFCSMSRKPN
jgi:hypothetical protein